MKKGKTSDYSQLERALDLVVRLQAGQRLTVRKIADIYDVSYRHSLRITRAVERTLPVSSERVNGELRFRWMP
jgi:predicted DNA-binding transcriptional regulator YafY